ncbi:hypothetical protein KXW38_001538, partial [Aspergillus fumigatus]
FSSSPWRRRWPVPRLARSSSTSAKAEKSCCGGSWSSDAAFPATTRSATSSALWTRRVWKPSCASSARASASRVWSASTARRCAEHLRVADRPRRCIWSMSGPQARAWRWLRGKLPIATRLPAFSRFLPCSIWTAPLSLPTPCIAGPTRRRLSATARATT